MLNKTTKSLRNMKTYLEFKNDLAPRVAKLPYIIRVGDVAVVHAEVIKSHIDQVSLKDTKSMIWGRTRVQNTNRDLVEGVSHVVVGHTPVRLPVTIGNHVYIDTGACFPSGSLTLIQDTQLEAVEKA